MNDFDILLKLREEEWALLRHYEEQRTTVTNIVIAITSIAIGFIVQKGINRDTLPIAILIIALGIYGILAVAKLYERIHLANDLAIGYTKLLDERYPKIGIEKVRSEIRSKHKTEFPRTTKLKMNTLWVIFHLAIALAGIALTIFILIRP